MALKITHTLSELKTRLNDIKVKICIDKNSKLRQINTNTFR